jgi:mercuric ion binding protein
MKYTVLLAATLVLASCSSPEPESLTIPATAIEPMAEATANAEASLFISGMTCEMGCKGIIESKLGKSAGIVNFEITFADSTAVVSYDSTLVSPSEITARVAAVGGGDLYSATLKK